MEIILVCGYKRTGKDYLFNILTSNVKHISWLVYSNKRNRLGKVKNGIRKSFADKLKHEVNDVYGIIYDETTKDIKQYLYNDRLVSGRDLCIELAKIRRDENINYWVEYVYQEIVNLDDTVIITDFRNVNEYEYLKSRINNVITVRVFRSDIEIPNLESEHYLDEFTTDYLLVLNVRDLDMAKKIFPQYQDYVYCGKL